MKEELNNLERLAISGAWLLWDNKTPKLSSTSYSYLWKNILTIHDAPRLVKIFWKHSHRYYYFNYHFKERHSDNAKRLLEIHYALGGLLLYSKQYESLKYIIEYTHSDPATYCLHPETMTEIFTWVEYFRNEFKQVTPIEYRYFFPGLDNYGLRKQTKYWIVCYFVTLFIRQFTLSETLVYQDFISLPELPDKFEEIYNMKESLSYFKMCFHELNGNEEYQLQLEYLEIHTQYRDKINNYFVEFESNITNKIRQLKIDSELNEYRKTEFINNTSIILQQAFEQYKDIFMPFHEELKDTRNVLSIRGEQRLIHKMPFIDDIGQTYINFNSVFAEAISTFNIKRNIVKSFFLRATKRYLLNKMNLIDGLKILIGNNHNLVIVTVSFDDKLLKEMKSCFEINKQISITSTEYLYQNTLFILDSIDLPEIEYKEISSKQINDYKLDKILDEYNVYMSLLDVSKDNDLLRKVPNYVKKKDDDENVLMTIEFNTNIYWKNDIELIQLNIQSIFQEQGIENELNELKPFGTV